MRKEGSAYDLTLAVGILAGSEQIPATEVDQYMIMGELSLDGGLQPIKGALPIAIKAREAGLKGFILPSQNAREAAIVDGIDVYGRGQHHAGDRFLQRQCSFGTDYRQHPRRVLQKGELYETISISRM
jgi:predicted ATPase with chaperone activity